jgi:hypothetical protein
MVIGRHGQHGFATRSLAQRARWQTRLQAWIARLWPPARHPPHAGLAVRSHAQGALRPVHADHHRSDRDPAGVVAFVFMERHWQTVTFRLSSMVTQNIAAIIEVYENYPQDEERRTLTNIAANRLGLTIAFLPPDPLPPQPRNRSFRCSTQRCPARSRARSAGRSGSTLSDAPTLSKSASSSKMPCCVSMRAAARPTPRTRTSSLSGWL